MNTAEVQKEVKRKEQSRKIVREILNFGVTDSQKIDIMFFLALELEKNDQIQEITSILKKYRILINNKEEKSSIVSVKDKILTV
jgi:hypothetical protein